jgi:predicted lysophospholipase L1 biosynthesis ABC-type transport system permease subunit
LQIQSIQGKTNYFHYKKRREEKKIREAVVREQLSRRLNVKVGEMINTEIPF